MNIIWFSEIRWDYLRTRKQHLLSYFPNGDSILFIQPPSLSNRKFQNQYNYNIICKTIPVYKKGNYIVDMIFNFSFVRKVFYKIISYYSNILIFYYLNRKVDVVCASNLYYIPLFSKIDSPIVWDFNDDPEQFGYVPSWALIMYKKLLSDKSTMIISCSKGLNEYIYSEFNNQPTTISNGVEISKFQNKIKVVKKKNKIIIGYIGIISKWFFDFNLIKLICKKYPEVEIRIYGPEDKNASSEIQEIKSLEKVTIYPVLEYEKLPLIISEFDIGIIPLKSEEKVWRAASAKLLQYLAVGIPVVSVYMEQYVEFTNLILCKTNEEFISGLDYFLNNNDVIEKNDLSKYDWKYLSIEFRNELEVAIESFN